MCMPKPKAQGPNTPPPPPQKLAETLKIKDPRDPAAGKATGKSSLIIDRSVGGVSGGSGLAIGAG